jgi:hypothetical protein
MQTNKLRASAVAWILLVPLFMGLLFIGGTEAIDPPELDETSWMKGIVDSESEVSNVINAAIDSNGYLHVSYYDTNGQDLIYATNAGGLWKTEIVDSVGNVGKHNSIDVDAAGTIHISYYDSTNQDLKYAKGTFGSWTTSTIDSIGVVGEYNSLVCIGDAVHITYLDYSNNTLKHAERSGSAWSLEVAAEDVGLGSALTANDGVLYSSFISDDGKLYCAVKNGTAWMIEEVDVTASFAKEMDIAVSDGTVFVSYIDNNAHVLKAATRSAVGSWNFVVVDSVTMVNTLSWPSASGDSFGNLHITYYDWGNQDLCYAMHDGSTWSLSKLDESGGVCSAIVSDDNNKQHVFYIDLVLAKTPLSYITNSGAKWVAETVDQQGDVGEQSAIAVDADGFVHIAYYDDTNGTLNYASNVNGWESVVVDNSSVSVGLNPSIALDSEGYVHISYYDEANQALRYATNAGGVWTTEPRDVGNVGLYSSISIDSDGGVHIVYLSSTSKNLKYTGNSGGDWVINLVDSSGNVESRIATGVDSDDMLHVMYYRGGELIHANQTATGWFKESVESTDQLGGGISMYIDENDVIYCTYYNTFSSTLKCIRNVGGEWNASESIESEGQGGIGSAIAVDSNGNERITYVDTVNGVLKYAERRNGIWMYQKVDLDGVGEVISMAMDALGRAHISYYDPISQDLRYATSITVPSAPLNLTADVDTGSVTLSWDMPINDGGAPITHFLIYRGSTAEALTVYAEVDGASDSFIDSGLENGITWIYRVKAGNSEGYSVYSNQVTATPCTLPGAPDVDAKGEDGAVVLDWDAPDNGGAAIEKYNIYRKNDSGVYVLIATVDGGVTYYKDTGLENGKEYFYYVTAVNPAGEGPESDPVSATPEEGMDMMLMIVIIIVVLAALGVGAFFFLKKGGRI